jgi:tRNA-dihydrouridine synthase
MLIGEGYPDATGKMKQFASWFTHGVEGGAKLRKAIYESKSAESIVDAVDLFFGAAVVEKEECGARLGESCLEERCGY